MPKSPNSETIPCSLKVSNRSFKLRNFESLAGAQRKFSNHASDDQELLLVVTVNKNKNKSKNKNNNNEEDKEKNNKNQA